MWENEFFNRSIRRVYDLGSQAPGNLPESPLAPQPDGTLATAGHAIDVPYAVADESSHIAGTPLARDSRIGLVLLATHGVLRLAYATTGIYPGDVWSGSSVSFTRFRCTGGSVRVLLGSDGTLFKRAQTVKGVSGAHRASVTFAPSTTPTLRLLMTGRPDGTCRARFTVSPTAVPAAIESLSNDTRVLGARFLAFRYTAP